MSFGIEYPGALETIPALVITNLLPDAPAKTISLFSSLGTETVFPYYFMQSTLYSAVLFTHACDGPNSAIERKKLTF